MFFLGLGVEGSLVKEKRAHYAEMESMRGLLVGSQGFNLVDEFYARWHLERVDNLSAKEAARAMEMRMVANLKTYCLEKDIDVYGLKYVSYMDKGVRRLNTTDHDSFASLEHMCLEAAKKVRYEGGDWQKETAMLWGVRRLSRLLYSASPGEKYVLLYPPLAGGETSIIYEYEVLNGGEVKVRGKSLNLSLDSMVLMYDELRGDEDLRSSAKNKREMELELVAAPIAFQGETRDLFKRAIVLADREGSESLDLMFDGGVVPEEYWVQMKESGVFLARYLERIYQELGGAPLTQNYLEKLEMAFSFARRAVLNAGRNGVVLSYEDLWKDLELRERVKLMRGFDSCVMQADLNLYLMRRYGDLQAFTDRGGFCPEAMLMAMGLGGGFDSPETMMQVLGGIEGGVCGRKVCAVDRGHNVPDDAKECPVCGWAPGRSVSNHSQKHSESKAEKTRSHMRGVKAEGLAEVYLRVEEPKTKHTNGKAQKEKYDNQKMFGLFAAN